jgi:hypothetical protein
MHLRWFTLFSLFDSYFSVGFSASLLPASKRIAHVLNEKKKFSAARIIIFIQKEQVPCLSVTSTKKRNINQE